MSQRIKNAVQKIKALKQELQNDLAEVPNMVIRTDHVLDTLSNGLLHLIGESPTTQGSTFTPTPITNVLGDDVTQQEKIDVKEINPTTADKEALKQQALDAYNTFLDRDSNVILESVDDLVIRAVAKKAGVADVTSTVPEKITVEFIEAIKEAISNKAALDEAKGTTSSETNTEGLTEEIIQHQISLFEMEFNRIAIEHGHALDEFQMTDEQRELLKVGITETLNSGVSTDELMAQYTKETTIFFERLKESQEAISNTINKIVELQKATNEKAGKEFTEADEKELREHFQNSSIEDMEAIIKEMDVVLKDEPAKKEETPAPTTTTNTTKKNNRR